MKDGKRQKKERRMRYEILPKGWRFIIASTLISMFIYPSFFKALGNIWERAIEIHWYDCESKRTTEKECTILEVREFFSPMNKYQSPVFEVTLQEGGTKFKEVFEEKPGVIGDKVTVGVEKGRYLGERPNYTGLDKILLLPTLYILFILVYLLFEIPFGDEFFFGGCIRDRVEDWTIESCGPGLIIILFPEALMLISAIMSWAVIFVFL